jgi:hyperosmotically inducible protein
MERVKGIEPSYAAWEAAVLPLNYTRDADGLSQTRRGIDSPSMYVNEPISEPIATMMRGASKRGQMMKTSFVITIVLVGTLFGSGVALAAVDGDTDRSHPGTFVKDSAITTAVKSKLAMQHITSVGRIHVDTDANGIVWLTGTARSQQAIDQAIAIARGTDGVKSVHSELAVRADD